MLGMNDVTLEWGFEQVKIRLGVKNDKARKAEAAATKEPLA